MAGVVVALALTATAGATRNATPCRRPTRDGAAERLRRRGELPLLLGRYVVDTDLGADDVVALAMLLRHPAVDVRAITVSGTGLVHCPVGVGHVRSILLDLGVRDRSVGCGRPDAGRDGLAFPPPWRRSSDNLYGLQLPNGHGRASNGEDAVTVMNAAITSSPSRRHRRRSRPVDESGRPGDATSGVRPADRGSPRGWQARSTFPATRWATRSGTSRRSLGGSTPCWAQTSRSRSCHWTPRTRCR